MKPDSTFSKLAKYLQQIKETDKINLDFSLKKELVTKQKEVIDTNKNFENKKEVEYETIPPRKEFVKLDFTLKKRNNDTNKDKTEIPKIDYSLDKKIKEEIDKNKKAGSHLHFQLQKILKGS